MQPFWIDNATEATDESDCLIFNLCVHTEVSHEVNVADPIMRGQS